MMPYVLEADGSIRVRQLNDERMTIVERQLFSTYLQGTDVRVSTVFLEVDHGHIDRVQLLFETMVFGGVFDGEQRRCTSLENAKCCHDEMVAQVKRSISYCSAHYYDSMGYHSLDGGVMLNAEEWQEIKRALKHRDAMQEELNTIVAHYLDLGKQSCREIRHRFER